MAIRNPIIAEIAYRTWCIDEYGMDAMFLLEGSEKALLIDTGTGVFDLPALLPQLTDRPVQAALTHGHVDHAGGMNMFPEVYAHPDDFEMARGVTAEDRRDYTALIMGLSGGIYDITPDSVVVSERQAQLLPLKGGAVISLGNRDIEVFETPGHTPGGLSFLDRKERLLFSGDACNMNTILTFGDSDRKKSGISDLLRTAKLLEDLHPFYDRHYNGHIGYADMVSVMPMPESLVRDCIELCEGLLDGSRAGVPDASNPFAGPCLLARNRTMQILYTPEQVR